MKTGISMVRGALVLGGMMLICLSAFGCKAGPGKNTGFVDPKMMAKDATLPFHSSWKQPGLELAKYKKIYIAPVETGHLRAESDWEKGDRKEQFEADIETLARYTRTAVEKAFTDDPAHHFMVVDKPGKDSDTLAFHIAITEVVPSKVVLNALGYAPFFVGTGVTLVRTIANDQSTVAFEARLIDASTGQTVVMLADREAEQKAAVTVRGLTWYSHAQSIISQWAAQFVQTTNQKPGETIKDTDAFTIQPW